MGSCLAEKQWEHKVDRASSFNAEIKNEWSCTCTPPMYLCGAERDNVVIILKKRIGS
jgi:hypothetical protein